MKQRELKEAVEFLGGSLNTLFKYKTIIHFPLSYEIWIDETKGGYSTHNNKWCPELAKDILPKLVQEYDRTPFDEREIMNGDRILDYYIRKDR